MQSRKYTICLAQIWIAIFTNENQSALCRCPSHHFLIHEKPASLPAMPVARLKPRAGSKEPRRSVKILQLKDRQYPQGAQVIDFGSGEWA